MDGSVLEAEMKKLKSSCAYYRKNAGCTAAFSCFYLNDIELYRWLSAADDLVCIGSNVAVGFYWIDRVS